MFAFIQALIPNPLHPAVVHMPIVLAMLTPIFAVGALIAIRRGGRPPVVWGLAIAVLALLSASAWASLETGEDQEERVEQVVPEVALESHQEAAEAFMSLTVLLLVIGTAGLLPRRAGTVARVVTTVGSVAIVVAAWQVGHSGGELVYRHGAASAYAGADPLSDPAAGQNERTNGRGGDADDDDDDDDDRRTSPDNRRP